MNSQQHFVHRSRKIEACEWLDELGIVLAPLRPDSQIVQQLEEIGIGDGVAQTPTSETNDDSGERAA